MYLLVNVVKNNESMIIKDLEKLNLLQFSLSKNRDIVIFITWLKSDLKSIVCIKKTN